jgi:hypothetical protein
MEPANDAEKTETTSKSNETWLSELLGPYTGAGPFPSDEPEVNRAWTTFETPMANQAVKGLSSDYSSTTTDPTVSSPAKPTETAPTCQRNPTSDPVNHEEG